MSSSSAIFLFAHQDDEFGVYQNLLLEAQSGRQVFCAYLTDGGKLSQRRNKESLAVLRKLGIAEQSVSFAGSALAIADGLLPECMEKAACWIGAWLSSLPKTAVIYTPAWEGGHQDHDALHAITVIVATELGLLDRVKQFSLYNAYKCPGLLFRTLRPLGANGPVEKSRIPWGYRFKFLSYCLSYPSQKITWFGLFPFVAIYYLTSGVQMLQSVSGSRIYQRPHDGALYYEKRNFYVWENFIAHLLAFLSTRDSRSQA